MDNKNKDKNQIKKYILEKQREICENVKKI